MFWQDDDDKNQQVEIPEDIVDCLFKIDCKALPLDHGDVLRQQLLTYLPWLDDEPLAAVHQIHVAESANGWMRPQDPETELLQVSHRTKMTLRLPQERLDDVRALIGQTLDIAGHPLTVGDFKTRKLSRLTTIFARYVDTGGSDDENAFLHAMHQQLVDRGIVVKKMMSGRLLTHASVDGPVMTRKLMLSDLDVQQSLMLQQQGIGDKKLMGLGIFMPHKGIDAVNKKQES